ncbi:hypothetical protein VSAK1_08351 [Vibrio mediterranei AK1]|uniref:hypothetical protein n=1 Tax=Vibrio mediterranei TaxID=689 RepID=UPI0001540EFE|nr:hypothetical protein [Vibrio mediterranei]EDL54006.1 hypothetical protein VSAK1_08351 [Vibrio mediterranei AK1]
MYKILIEKGLDGFSVLELRDAVQKLPEIHTDKSETRRRVYRQILRFKSNNWLEEKEHKGQKKYFRTKAFSEQGFEVKTARVEELDGERNQGNESDYGVLKKEIQQHEAELEIVLSEIEEYRSLHRRFPEFSSNIDAL